MTTAMLMILGILGSIAGIILLVLGIMHRYNGKIILGSILTFVFGLVFIYSLVIAIEGYFDFLNQMIYDKHSDRFMRDSLMDPQSLIDLCDDNGNLIQINQVSFSSVYSGFVDKNSSTYYYTSLYFPSNGLPESEIEFNDIKFEGQKFEFYCSKVPPSIIGKAEVKFYFSPDSLIAKGLGTVRPCQNGFCATFDSNMPEVDYIDFIVINAAE